MKLRPYQISALRGVAEQWQDVRSTLLVLPTGCGKTVCFADILRRRRDLGRGRALILAHRSELLTQAARTLGAVGLSVELEQASERAQVAPSFSGHSDVVVASVQTLHKRRLERWPSDHFATVIVDEGHHATAKSYRNVLEHFDQAKVLLVTATPDRTDKKGLWNVVDSVAYSYTLLDAIRDGWLVAVEQKGVLCDELDLTDIKITKGDLNEAEVGIKMADARVCAHHAALLVEHGGDRPTLVFCAGVDAAHAQADALRKVTGRYDAVEVVDGTTPRGARDDIYRRFGNGDVQYLVNCQVLTEGFDAPLTACVAVMRPTKSRALYAQMVGRGTRPLKGVVDGPETAEARRAAIAASGKPDVLVLDFKGNAGRQDLVGVLDILGGEEIKDEVRADAERAISDGVDVEKALAEAEQRYREKEARERARQAKVQISVRTRAHVFSVNPFGCLDGVDDRGPRASDASIAHLRELGVNVTRVPSHEQASRMVDELTQRARKGLCSLKQAKLISARGIDPTNITKRQASGIIGEIAKKEGWKR